MTLEEIEESTEKDPTLQAVLNAITNNNWHIVRKQPAINKAAFDSMRRLQDELSATESGKIILRGTRIVIPAALQQKAIDIAHSGHQGIVKTKALIREKVWFAGIDNKVETTIRNCMSCQITTPTTSQEPLKMSPLPARPWSELSVDRPNTTQAFPFHGNH
jgi:hypothetical protein